MDIVLVRHGAWDSHVTNGGLNERGRHQARMLARALGLRGVVPDRVLTSGEAPAKETAGLLAEALNPDVALVELDAITPRKGPGGLDDLLSQAEAAVEAPIRAAQSILVVGHEGRLSDLLTELTGARSRPFEHGGAACVRGLTFEELAAGRGTLWHRYPTVDHDEEAVRAKVHSKMAVSTFLAGFVFTALSTLLLEEASWPWHRVLAAATLTASLALFVAAVYIYDELGTPSGFWTDARPRRSLWRRRGRRHERPEQARWTKVRNEATGTDLERGQAADEDTITYHLRHDGRAYWLMVNTSRMVFTPAVVLALVGFVALLVGTEDWRIWTTGLAALTLAGVYAARRRPNIAAD